MSGNDKKSALPPGLYTAEQRRRRDATPWTRVQAVLAPIQFLVFVASAALVWRYLATGDGAAVAVASVVLKTLLLYSIMITGAIWEKAVFGRYLFAPAFYWEDVVSMLVIALHTAYLACLVCGWLTLEQQFHLALIAYLTYAINAGQFLAKFRRARRSPARDAAGGRAGVPA